MKWIRIAEPTGGSFNLMRKLWHLFGLVVPLFLYFDMASYLQTNLVHSSRVIGSVAIFLVMMILLGIDLYRFRSRAFNRLFFKVAGSILKREEKKRINATIPYLLANLILFLFFGKEIVVIGSLFLMIGDPAAAYFGSHFGRLRFWNGKSLEGMLGFMVVGSIASILFLLLHSYLEPNDEFALYSSARGFHFYIIIYVLVGAVFSAISEFFASNQFMGFFDDNLVVPLVGVTGMALAGLLFPAIPVDALFFPVQNLFDLY